MATNKIQIFLKKLVFLTGVIVFLFLAMDIQAQKKVDVTARGKYEARDLTLEQVKNKAVDEAKRNAMTKAGIAENVTVNDFLYTFEDNEKFQEIFQSFVSTETGADIVVHDIREIDRDINEFGNILMEVEIDATVYKHKKEADPAFTFKVEGVRNYYIENDPLKFSFLPSFDGYLKIFNVTDETAFILYPYKDPENPVLNDKTGKKFNREAKVAFPVNPNLDGYYFAIDNPQKPKEYNLLIFVYTKKDIAFLEEVRVTSIMEWIYDIPPDQRHVEQYGIIVSRNN
jgi:hypothetical protein